MSKSAPLCGHMVIGGCARASQSCLGTILGKGNCAITVTYTPTGTSSSTDTLTIVDTPDGITRNVPLKGTGK